MDDATAMGLVEHQDELEFRVRRLAKVRPSGIESPLLIYELVSNDALLSAHITSEQFDLYEVGLDAFLAGDWKLANDSLSSLSELDQPSQMLCTYMQRYGIKPPAMWDGVMDLPKY